MDNKTPIYNLKDFDYHLPQELIAHHPKTQRDDSRLLVQTYNNQLIDSEFRMLPQFLNSNDLLIANNSKVIKARLLGNKVTGAKVEILVERINHDRTLICHIKTSKSITENTMIIFPDNLQLQVIKKIDELFLVKIHSKHVDLFEYLQIYGLIPLPPYINRNSNINDETRYQTVYADEFGSVAAPTAGLHFTKDIITNLINKNIKIAYLTLHIGAGTFKPVKTNDINLHKMHNERYYISDETVNLIHETKSRGGKIIAVGTTSLRVLETIANNNYQHLSGETDIFITPGYKFKLVDQLITNFHLPKSTLIMLVAAFSGLANIKDLYNHAINKQYRFFSYGDAMLLNRKEI